ncbi:MAG: acyl carrier protein [Epsilonproteobacteria bacterium]|nr:MAG: acyl carrier protein [Campylobacterota bacterium]
MVEIETLKSQLIALFQLEGVNAADLSDEAALFHEGLGLDSVDAIELTIFLDNEYEIVFDNMADSETAFVSIKKLVEYINEHGVL